MTRAALAAVLGCALLAGCSSAAEITGLAAGGVAGGASANPAIGYAVAVGTAAAADEAFKYISRVRQRAEQNAIADAASTLGEGQTAAWTIRHTVPIDNEHGQVQVVRLIDTPLAICREIAFSVEDAPKPGHWFVTSICQQARRWKWAAAEPAVERWGYLQ